MECGLYTGLDGIEATVGSYSGVWAIHGVEAINGVTTHPYK